MFFYLMHSICKLFFWLNLLPESQDLANFGSICNSSFEVTCQAGCSVVISSYMRVWDDIMKFPALYVLQTLISAVICKYHASVNLIYTTDK